MMINTQVAEHTGQHRHQNTHAEHRTVFAGHRPHTHVTEYIRMLENTGTSYRIQSQNTFTCQENDRTHKNTQYAHILFTRKPSANHRGYKMARKESTIYIAY